MSKRTVAGVTVAVVLGLWVLLGVVFKGNALDSWSGDYTAAKLHALTPLPGSREAADFAADYEALDSSNIVTGPFRYMAAHESHKAWAATMP